MWSVAALNIKMTRRGGSEQKVSMVILSTEAFSQNFEFLGSSILRQSKCYVTAKNYPIDLRLALNEN